jgi:Septum formation
MRSIGIRLGIVAVVVIAFVVLRPFLSGNAGGLSVGDCFDVPAGAGETVSDVQHHPCTESHGAEVVFVGDFKPSTSIYPTDDEFTSFGKENCVPAFNAYTGLDFETATTYDIEPFFPTADGWTKGDRKVICFAVRADSAPMTTSVKKS